ncbi:MAG TPA: UPF0182 family protein, partial [Acidimicrobiales bacterium]|nr:UPF0182 family protein [Acidimicrobiales bacterium]
AVFFTDRLWFTSLGQGQLWSHVLTTKVSLVLVFSSAVFAMMWVNLAVVDHVAPPLDALGPENELVRRYRSVVGRRPLMVRALLSAVLGLLVGASASTQWRHWILLRNAVAFPGQDPLFHKNIAFFVFTLPFLSFVAGWAFVAAIVVAVLIAVAHYLNGGIRVQGPGERISPRVKAHLSLLLALVALIKAAGYYLARYQLEFSGHGHHEGAFYTAVHATLPALTLLIFVSLVCGAMFVVNLVRKGWVLPVIGVTLWGLVAVVVGMIYPATVQAFTVNPSQLAAETPYLRRNIRATRVAMGIDHVKATPFADSTGLTARHAAGDLATLKDVRLWTPRSAQVPFNRLQALRAYYQVATLGLDRYNVGGTLTPTLLGVRQLRTGHPGGSWVNQHLQYTHGYGAVLAPANRATVAGNPSFVIRGVPPTSSPGSPVIRQPGVYFGTGLPGYVVANTAEPELDYQNPATGQSVEGHYQGTGGVPAGGLVRRAAFAVRFGSINPLVSNLIGPQSRFIFERDVRARAQKLAPFLAYDSRPYPVVANGRLVYVLDAYTTTRHYPYAQQADTAALPPTSGLAAPFNYVRNSVKVVVDAYSGKTTFYVVDPHDPIIQAWEQAFPRLFTPASAMPEDLRSHLRYARDLFTVQAAMYARYHTTDPAGFYNGADAWSLAQDPGMGPLGAGKGGKPSPPTSGPGASPMAPSYQVSRLPGDPSLTFNLTEPYVASSPQGAQQNLTGFLAARCTPGRYGDGQLEAYATPRGQQYSGPSLVDAQIQQNASITAALGRLDQHGAEAFLGPFTMVPVGQALLFVRPVYVQSKHDPLPQLQRVIVFYADRSAMAPTLAGAVAGVLGAPVTGLAPPGAALGGVSVGAQGASPAVAALIEQANAALAQAQADLGQQDLSGYQHEVGVAQQLLDQAQQLETGAGPPSQGPAGGNHASTTATTAGA